LNYFAIDVYLPSINWCQRAFSIASDRFQFLHYDGKSARYNPKGKIAQTEYQLPLPNETIDMTVCGSVFTHLYELAAKHYLSEIYRVTKKGGQALISIHTAPKDGKQFCGDEARKEGSPDYFKKLCG